MLLLLLPSVKRLFSPSLSPTLSLSPALALFLAVYATLVHGSHSSSSSAPVPSPEVTAPLHSHSLHSPFIEENLNNRWWDFGGDAVVDVNSHIRLTEDMQSKVGWLWSRTTLTAASWVVEVEYKVSGNKYGLHGDGWAFWYTTEREQEGPVFGSKDEFTGLGVFFDTYANGRQRYTFPYISAMIGDGKTKYDHDNDGNANSIGGCPCDFRGLVEPNTTKVKITFVKNQFLRVETDILGDGVWRECFLKTNVTLPPYGFLGFSAFTGEVSDHHDIYSISTSSITSIKDYAGASHLNNSAYSSSGGSSILSILFWLALIGGVAGGAWYWYQQKQRGLRGGYKRF